MPINYAEYPKNWFTEIRPAALKRAGEVRNENGTIRVEARCENCGVENHSIRNGTRIALTIAHLDHDKENHEVSLDRLAAWCQKCHLAYDLPRHMEKARKNREKKKGLQRLFE
jgi:5-methylcytosine-specific restriction endonuclease McrA